VRPNKITAALWIIGAVMFSIFAVSAAAQDMLTPGPIDGGHAEHISKCSSCHQPLAGPTDSKCLNCHKNIARAELRKSNVHYLVKMACSDCHKLHGTAIGKARLRLGAQFHPNAQGFMEGKHSGIDCRGCHPGSQYERLSKACESCHDQRPHGPTIRSGCAKCHTTLNWEKAKSKHVTNLVGKHKTAPCGACHRGMVPSQTPRDCSACHSAEHKARVSTACDSCHNQVSWKQIKRDHRPEANCRICHAKPSEHRDGPCLSCHTTDSWAFSGHQANSDCSRCHAAPAGHFGPNCGSCHNTKTWQGASFAHPTVREHSYQSFPCRNCHPNGLQTWTCTGCHDSNNPQGD